MRPIKKTMAGLTVVNKQYIKFLERMTECTTRIYVYAAERR